MNRQIQKKKWEGVKGKRAVGSTRNNLKWEKEGELLNDGE